MKFYNGNPSLKKENQEIHWTLELMQEYAKCEADPIYFIETYMKIVHVDHGLVDFKLYDYQKDIIKDLQNNRNNAFCMARQSGKSITVCGFLLWYVLFNENKEVGILANKGDTAREILGRIQLAYQHLPLWLTQGVKEWNKGLIHLENGCKIIATATSSNNARGHSFAMIYLDEVAFIENYNEFYTSILPTISSGKETKIIMTSTPKGLNHFYKTIEMGKMVGTANWNGFNIKEVPWYKVPGRDEAWKQKTLQEFEFDYEKFDQEYNIQFLGSSGTLITGSKLKELVHKKPYAQGMGVKQYEEAKKDRSYIAIADVSRGKGLDYSALQVIDITEMPYKQVLIFRDNMTTPGDFSEIIYRIVKKYNNACVLVEVNDIGEQVSDSLYFDFSYENIIFTESNGRSGKRATFSYKNQSTDKGIRTTKTVKSVGCSLLKLLIEQNQLILVNEETIDELKRFSKKNNTYQAEVGSTDDLTMCLVLFSWLTDQDLFRGLTDINTLMKLKDHNSENVSDEMVPLGIYTDSVPTHGGYNRVGDNWIVVNDHQNYEEEIGWEQLANF